MTPGGGTVEEIQAFLRSERSRWEIAVKESGAEMIIN